jgi:hypothetical protein
VDKGYKTFTYETGEVDYRGVYLRGVFTQKDALALHKEATELVKAFDRMDAALKKSMGKNT